MKPAAQKKAVSEDHRIVGVQILEAKPNKMFTEQHRQLVRFLRYSMAVPCAECGRRKRTHWTMLFSFQAMSMGFLVPKKSGKIHMPLTPVCTDHILAHPDHKEPTAVVLDQKGNANVV